VKTIMAVDDSASLRQMVGVVLRGGGYQVIESVDGVDALSKLKSGQELHLFLTDINMPKMDGLEFTRQLRAMPQYKFVPIVLLTTESNPDKKQQGKAAGATAWIVKPFDPDQLLAVVKKVMR
jgi:two-component system, chemotaxis family, chemotaxis protein CheY